MFAIRSDRAGKSEARQATGAAEHLYRRPPYWGGAGPERTLRGMRPLAILPDNITTDHLSPSMPS